MSARSVGVGMGGLALVFLASCSKKETPTRPAEVSSTTPAAIAAPAPTPSATEAKSAPPPAANPAAIATGKSKAPTVAEWNAEKEVDVRFAARLGCELKVVREWVRVSCRTVPKAFGTIVRHRVVDGSTFPQGSYEFDSKSADVTSTVFPVHAAVDARIAIDWDEEIFERILTLKATPGGTLSASFDQDADHDQRKAYCGHVCAFAGDCKPIAAGTCAP